MRILWVVVVALMIHAAPARAAEAISKSVKLDGGFQEVVISVADLEQSIAFYRRVAGWVVVHRGPVQPEIITAWKLPDAVRGNEAVLRNPGDPSGFARLIQFRGVNPEETRPNARPWDTGGFAGFEVYAREAWQKYGQFRQGGWHAFGQPIQHQTGGTSAISVLMQGPVNEVIGINQRIEPPLRNFANLRELSHVYSVFATVKDFDGTLAFYEKLGFKVFNRDQGLAAPSGRNIFGLPSNLVNNIYRRLAWLHPRGDVANDPHLGSITLGAYYGVQGDDYSHATKPPNLGLIAVRFPVSDADERAAAIRAAGVTLEYQPVDVGMMPYGPARMFGVLDPNGALLEFFEPGDKPD